MTNEQRYRDTLEWVVMAAREQYHHDHIMRVVMAVLGMKDYRE